MTERDKKRWRQAGRQTNRQSDVVSRRKRRSKSSFCGGWTRSHLPFGQQDLKKRLREVLDQIFLAEWERPLLILRWTLLGGEPFCSVTALREQSMATPGCHLGGDVAQLVERRTGTPLRLLRFPGAARDFSPRVNFQCRLSYGVLTSPVFN